MTKLEALQGRILALIGTLSKEAIEAIERDDWSDLSPALCRLGQSCSDIEAFALHLERMGCAADATDLIRRFHAYHVLFGEFEAEMRRPRRNLDCGPIWNSDMGPGIKIERTFWFGSRRILLMSWAKELARILTQAGSALGWTSSTSEAAARRTPITRRRSPLSREEKDRRLRAFLDRNSDRLQSLSLAELCAATGVRNKGQLYGVPAFENFRKERSGYSLRGQTPRSDPTGLSKDLEADGGGDRDRVLDRLERLAKDPKAFCRKVEPALRNDPDGVLGRLLVEAIEKAPHGPVARAVSWDGGGIPVELLAGAKERNERSLG